MKLFTGDRDNPPGYLVSLVLITVASLFCPVSAAGQSRQRANVVDQTKLAKQLKTPLAPGYDFIQKGEVAKWWRTLDPSGSISWNGPGDDPRGFVGRRANATLEDGTVGPLILETRPELIQNGAIFGNYLNVPIPANARFVARVGFLQGAQAADGAFFQVIIRSPGQNDFKVIAEQKAKYDNRLDELAADLSAFAGQTKIFTLLTRAYKPTGQLGAVWASAVIVTSNAKGLALKPMVPAPTKVPASPAMKSPQRFKTIDMKPIILAPSGPPPPKHQINIGPTLPVEEPLSLMNTVYLDNQRPNTYYFLPREIDLIRDEISENYKISAVWTQDQKVRLTLSLRANIIPEDVKILEGALKKTIGPQAVLLSLPYDEANIIDMKGWEDWQIADIRIPTFGSLEGELPISISMTPETLAQLKPLLEKEGLTSSMRIKSGDRELGIPIRVGLKYFTGRMYSPLESLSYSFNQATSLLTLHNVQNLSGFPLAVRTVNLRFRFPGGDEVYTKLRCEGEVTIPPKGTGSVTVKLVPGPLLTAAIAQAIQAAKPEEKKPQNTLAQQALEILKKELDKDKTRPKTGAESAPINPQVDAFFKGCLKNYWMDIVPDFESQECLDRIWSSIEVVSYIERMRKINLEALANIFDPASYDPPIEIEKIHIEIRSPYLSPQAKDGLAAAVDLSKEKLKDAVTVYLPLSSQEKLAFEYKIKAVLKTGESAESAEWESVADSLDLTLGTFHIKKVIRKAG
jgi:hypothetical protein